MADLSGTAGAVQEMSARHGLPPLIARILLNRGPQRPGRTSWPFWSPVWRSCALPSRSPTWKRPRPGWGRRCGRGRPWRCTGIMTWTASPPPVCCTSSSRNWGFPVLTYIPDRLQEGYGLKIPALQELARQARLLVTVDCGISDAGRGGLGPGAGAGGHRHRPPRAASGAAPGPGGGQSQAGG